MHVRHFTFDFIAGVFNKTSRFSCRASIKRSSFINSLTNESFNKKHSRSPSLSRFSSGLGTALQEITTNIVLLGDHKQLGAVVSSDVASRLGLGENVQSKLY
jgi:hypothetical protein